MEKYSVYALADEAGRVFAVNSDAFILDPAGWVKIDEGSGDKYHHAQGNYLPGPLTDENGVYRYKLEGGAIIERTQEDMNADLVPAFPKSPRNVVAGEYVTTGGVLYKATSNIPNGGSIITGQNAIMTSVEEQLYELTKGE